VSWKGWLAGSLCLLGIAGISLLGFWHWQARQSRQLQSAAAALETGDFALARQLAESIWGHPAYSRQRQQADLISGEAWLLDPSLPRHLAITGAFVRLGRIPVHSPAFPRSRWLMAEQRFFEAKKLHEAEDYIEVGLQHYPHDPDLNRWMINYLAATGRTTLCEPYFLAAAGGDGDAQPLRLVLQDWTLSQVAPERLEREFDLKFGIVGESEGDHDTNRLERFFTLMRLRPDVATFHAEIANWFLERDELRTASEHLLQGQPYFESWPDAHFLVVSVRALCRAGQLHQARLVLDALETMNQDYLFHRAAAEFYLASGQEAAAGDELEHAFQHWPGPLDVWGLDLLADHFTATSRDQDARQVRQWHQWLTAHRQAVADAAQNLEDPQSWPVLREFFQRSQRPVEQRLLEQLASALLPAA